jgi:hypothetical protein
MICEDTGTAIEGLYATAGSISAVYDALTKDVSDSDPSHYTGEAQYKVYLPLVLR